MAKEKIQRRSFFEKKNLDESLQRAGGAGRERRGQGGAGGSALWQVCASMPHPEREQVVDEVLHRCAVYVNVPVDSTQACKAELRSRCNELYDLWKGTSEIPSVAAALTEYARLTTREHDLERTAREIQTYHLPMVRTTTGTDSGLEKTISNYLATAQEYAERARSVLASEGIVQAQRRIVTLHQPYFVSAALRSNHATLASAMPRTRKRSMVSSAEPRVFLRATPSKDAPTAMMVLNQMFGVRHAHRPCRIAAAAPFGSPGILWKVQGRQLDGRVALPPDDLTRPGVNQALRAFALKHWKLPPCTLRADAPVPSCMQGKSLTMRLILPRRGCECRVLVACSPAISQQVCSVWGAQHDEPLETEACLVDACDRAVASGNTVRASDDDMVVKVHVCAGEQALARIRESETLGAHCDFATLWREADETLVHVRYRVPRFGERDGKMDAEVSWYDGGPESMRALAQLDSWDSRGVAAWCQLLQSERVRMHSALDTDVRDRLADVIWNMPEPLRWYTAKAAMSMHRVPLHDIRQTETAPSNVTTEQQRELICAAVWAEYAAAEADREACRYALRMYHVYIGRYPVVTADSACETSGARDSDEIHAWTRLRPMSTEV